MLQCGNHYTTRIRNKEVSDLTFFFLLNDDDDDDDDDKGWQ